MTIGIVTLQDPLTSEEIRLLAELGFMAGLSGQVVPALKIFQALSSLRSESAFPYLGMAVAWLSVGAFQTAVELLEDSLLHVQSEKEELLLYLALAFKRAGSLARSNKILLSLINSDRLNVVQEKLALAIRDEDLRSFRAPGFPEPAKIFNINTSSLKID